jgi:hypothetical protein
MSEVMFEDYLGDGLYVGFDGYQVILAANDKVTGHPTDKVYLEPNVIRSFMNYIARLKQEGVKL